MLLVKCAVCLGSYPGAYCIYVSASRGYLCDYCENLYFYSNFKPIKVMVKYDCSTPIPDYLLYTKEDYADIRQVILAKRDINLNIYNHYNNFRNNHKQDRNFRIVKIIINKLTLMFIPDEIIYIIAKHL